MSPEPTDAAPNHVAEDDAQDDAQAVDAGDQDTPRLDDVPCESKSKTPEPQCDLQGADSDTPSTPGQLSSFDWDVFEARYEAALRAADDREREIVKEAEDLSRVGRPPSLGTIAMCWLTRCKYFQAWAAAASAHDEERAVKRLRTRQRFVNLSEEQLAQKQQHCKAPWRSVLGPAEIDSN